MYWLILFWFLYEQQFNQNLIIWGSSASLIAGLATGFGCTPLLFIRTVSQRALDTMLGFAAGVMLSASFFSLILPAIDIGGIWMAIGGIVCGVVFIIVVDRLVPHLHGLTKMKKPTPKLRRVWLLILAIAIHNFPEGLSVGVGFGAGEIGAGLALAIAIGLQNMPEGLAVALPLLRENYSKWRASGYATMTGLVEPVGGVIGVLVVSIAHQFLPFALAFAAGAMIWVVSDEMIPESHSKGFEREATIGVIIGFLVMMILDNILA
ncbi:MAG: ZIP family metal transporter [Candidatus Jordarchaeum sp.]|uniref:ZIP family metal transporter n=1 Tax=Candidatus Jordarchaeum sp. TaxID=2823881 RepID=UPI00404B9464